MRPIEITVFGGTGFLGRHVVECLVHGGVGVRVAVRHPDYLPRSGNGILDHVEAVRTDIRNEDEVRAALAGVRAAVNAVGLYAEGRGQKFRAVHVDGARNVAWAAKEARLERLVHISGIGADPKARNRYIRCRGLGEEAVREAFPQAIIVRPSVLFGPGDSFLRTLRKLIRRLPVIPMFGKGETRLQPVHVNDVAQAVSHLALQGGSASLYELGGPEILTYDELLRLVMSLTGKERTLMALPMPVWQTLAIAGQVLPRSPVTPTQVALMNQDNVVSEDAASFADLGIKPASIGDSAADIFKKVKRR